MATVHHDNLQNWWEGPDHPEFLRRFNRPERQALIADDLFAGKSVSLVLIGVVAAGTIAMLGDPHVNLGALGRIRLFDFGGLIAIGGMAVALIVSVIRNAAELARLEPRRSA